MKKIGKRNMNITALLFLLPAIITALFILVYPMVYGIFMGFTNMILSYDKFVFIGLRNFIEVFNDPIFFISLYNSMKIVAFTVAFTTFIGFGLALLLNSSENYIKFFRTLLFLPWILPSTVVAFSFRWLYNDYYGYINYILLKYKIIDIAVNPLASERLVWIGVLVPIIWSSYPFVMLVMSSSLKSIDRSVYDAARIDGASRLQIFCMITIPIIKSTLIMLTILQIIWEFSSFDLVYLLTKGGPANATLTMSLYIYKKAFEFKQIGYASALSTTMFVILAFLIIIYSKLSKGGEKNEG
jgi:multiple sugar transport system permease protein